MTPLDGEVCLRAVKRMYATAFLGLRCETIGQDQAFRLDEIVYLLTPLRTRSIKILSSFNLRNCHG